MMPDITMCLGTNCVIKEDCYRYKATPDEYLQSYFSEVPFNKNMEFKGTRRSYCEYYWPNNAKDANP